MDVAERARNLKEEEKKGLFLLGGGRIFFLIGKQAWKKKKIKK